MKIAVAGKGGAGKTSITAGLAKAFAEKHQVIAVDADPSYNLASVLGIKKPKPLAEQKTLVEERARMPGGLVRMNPDVADLVDEYAAKVSANLRLIVMGTVTGAGKGCLCPENALLRSLLSNLVLKRDEYVVIDLEAGFEPMSRGTVKAIDALLIVCEPSANSISVSTKLVSLAGEAGIGKALVVANKTCGKQDLDFIADSLEVFHELPFDGQYSSLSRGGGYPSGTVFDGKVRELAAKIGDLN
ncbi:MAG: AAA family ATPase [Candidatus Altiarchaeota archaeon]